MKIGILHSLSGPMALSETSLVDATIMAIDEINQAGGVLGKRIRPILKDGCSDPTIFAKKAEQLIRQNEVSSIFGCWTSASRKSVKSVVEAHNSLLWYPVQYEGLEQSSNIVYSGSCPNQQIEPAVNWCMALGAKRIFLVGSDYVFPQVVNQLLRSIIEANDGQVVGEQYQPLTSQDFSDTVQLIKEAEPDFVLNSINGFSNIYFFREYKNSGVKAPILSFSFSELELAQTAESAVNHYACWSYFQTLDTQENRQFLSRWGTNRPVADPLVMAYSQPYLWKSSVESANSFDIASII